MNNDEHFKKTNSKTKKKERLVCRKIAGKSLEISPDISEDIEEIERQFVKVGQEDAEGMMPEIESLTPEYKGLARKVLPNIMGLLNSRIWSL